jgi:hypothetical protein
MNFEGLVLDHDMVKRWFPLVYMGHPLFMASKLGFSPSSKKNTFIFAFQTVVQLIGLTWQSSPYLIFPLW